MGCFSPSKVKTTTTTKLPDWVDKGGQGLFDLAKLLGTRPYTAYPFPRIAGFTPDQTDAMSMLRGYDPMGSQPDPYQLPEDFSFDWNYSTPRMIDNVPGGEGEGGGSIEDYMNPYVQNVVDRGMGQLRRAADISHQWQSNAGAHGAGAFGDARHGVADAQIEKNFVDQAGDFAAQQYSNAYDNAQQLRNIDISRLMQQGESDRNFARGMYGDDRNFGRGVYESDMNFARGELDHMLKYIDSLYRSGSNQQNLSQQSLSLGYEDFLRQLGYPQEQLNMMLAALRQTPYGQSQTNATPGPSTFGTLAGGLGSILSLFL